MGQEKDVSVLRGGGVRVPVHELYAERVLQTGATSWAGSTRMKWTQRLPKNATKEIESGERCPCPLETDKP